MAKKLSAPGRRPAHRKAAGGTLVGIFIGLVLGVLIAFGVVWYLNKSPLPFLDKVGRAEKKDERSAEAGSGEPLALPGKPGDKVSERKPRFDFYKILPGGQETAPAPAPAPAAKAAPPAATQPPPAEASFLQVGAFQQAQDADNLKAKLAMIGMEVGIQEAEVPEKGKMFRVRVGPFRDNEELNRARAQLSQQGIRSTIVKAKSP